MLRVYFKSQLDICTQPRTWVWDFKTVWGFNWQSWVQFKNIWFH